MIALTAVRAGFGAAQLLWPGLGLDRLLHRRLDGTGALVARILGARHVAQALISAPSPTAAVLALGAEVDALHAGSMYVLGMANRRYRVLALASAVVATGFAAAGSAATVRARRTWPVAHTTSRPIRMRDRSAQSLAPHLVPRWHAQDRKEST